MIEVEHLVYGSFHFNGSAQHIPDQSKGISKKIRKEITSFCDSWGECKNFKFYSSLNQIWIEDEPELEPKVAVIKITHHGRDFSGRGGHCFVMLWSSKREIMKSLNLIHSRSRI